VEEEEHRNTNHEEAVEEEAHPYKDPPDAALDIYLLRNRTPVVTRNFSLDHRDEHDREEVAEDDDDDDTIPLDCRRNSNFLIHAVVYSTAVVDEERLRIDGKRVVEVEDRRVVPLAWSDRIDTQWVCIRRTRDTLRRMEDDRAAVARRAGADD